jgi:hypothetical protein
VQDRKRGDSARASLLAAIDVELRSLSRRVDRAYEATRSKGSGSIVGSIVQVPQSDPTTQRAFDWLDEVKSTLETLNNEGSF